jgi:hypothetical protein
MDIQEEKILAVKVKPMIYSQRKLQTLNYQPIPTRTPVILDQAREIQIV